MLKNKRKFT